MHTSPCASLCAWTLGAPLTPCLTMCLQDKALLEVRLHGLMRLLLHNGAGGGPEVAGPGRQGGPGVWVRATGWWPHCGGPNLGGSVHDHGLKVTRCGWDGRGGAGRGGAGRDGRCFFLLYFFQTPLI